jgi:hypothetical protein
VGFIVFASVDPAATDETVWRPIDTLVWLLLPVSFVLGIWSWVLRRRARKRRDELRVEIETLKQRRLSPEEIEHQVVEKTATDPAANPMLISDLVSSSFLDSDEFRAVETFIVANPPALPREAKRSFNHAQLLTEIARARHMFGGSPELTPAHLAKWLLLREQFPATARAIAREPKVLKELESAGGGDDPELIELLFQTPPALGAVIERLVYFQPAENGRPTS